MSLSGGQCGSELRARGQDGHRIVNAWDGGMRTCVTYPRVTTTAARWRWCRRAFLAELLFGRLLTELAKP
jgi:hypothetical protein